MITPLGNRVVIRPIKNDEIQSESGILAPDNSKKKMTKGEVLEVGADVSRVTKGMTVVFSPFHFDEITEEMIVVDEKDIWAVVS